MRTRLSRPTWRRWAVLALLGLVAAPAFADSIGSLTLLSAGTWGNPMKPVTALQLNTAGMTFDAMIPGMPGCMTRCG